MSETCGYTGVGALMTDGMRKCVCLHICEPIENRNAYDACHASIHCLCCRYLCFAQVARSLVVWTTGAAALLSAERDAANKCCAQASHPTAGRWRCQLCPFETPNLKTNCQTGPRWPSSLLREPWPGTIMDMVGLKPCRNISPKTPTPPRPKTRPCWWLRLCRRGDTRLASGDRPASGHSSAPS